MEAHQLVVEADDVPHYQRENDQNHEHRHDRSYAYHSEYNSRVLHYIYFDYLIIIDKF